MTQRNFYLFIYYYCKENLNATSKRAFVKTRDSSNLETFAVRPGRHFISQFHLLKYGNMQSFLKKINKINENQHGFNHE